MANLSMAVCKLFQSDRFQNKPLQSFILAQEFIRTLMSEGFDHKKLAEATNCQSTSFSIWRRFNVDGVTKRPQFKRDTERVLSWLNQHLETDTPKPLPADIAVWVALSSDIKHPGRIFVPWNSRVQDIPKLLIDEETLPIKSDLDVESLTLNGEVMEWTRFCSSYSFDYPNLVIVTLSA